MNAPWLKRLACGSVLAMCGLFATAQVLAQAGEASARLAFEVATVKPIDASKMNMTELRVYPGGRLVIHSYTLRTLIANALNVPRSQVLGGDKWLDQTRFDIDAKPPAEMRGEIPGGEFSNGGIADPRIRQMLEALLVERFHLKVHHDSQPGTVYLLQRSDRPLKLEPARLNLYTRAQDGTIAPSEAYPTGDTGLAAGAPVGFYQTSMAQLSMLLTDMEHAPVIDQTGLAGYYTFKSQTIVTNDDFKSGNVWHLVIETLPEMGLKLVKTQGTVERYVIDHADPPTEN